jgi:uncharacterized RmlC-like cupin family protein
MLHDTDNEVRVVRAADMSDATAQTTGMVRRAGVEAGTTGATGIWMGHVTALPGMDSGPHHHGESETSVYVVRGQIRFFFGESYARYVDAGPGDFVYIPPHLPHIERNLLGAPAELIAARAPDNIVVNLD